jgi:dTDP-glucose 4,6-dehydratase
MKTKRNILVTGGAGFIGSNFVQYLFNQNRNDEVYVFDNLTYSGNLNNLAKFKDLSGFHFIKGDITDKGDIEKAITETITHIVHFAAESHVDRSISGPEKFIQTNIIGTFNILNRLRELDWAGNVEKRMIHVSTDEVYGSLGSEGFFSEKTCYKPNSPYSASKAASDHLVRAYYHTYQLPVITTNCSNNYGPYQFPEKLIPLIIINCLQGKELPVYGEGNNIRDWLYVEDHCSAINIIVDKGLPGETYAIGGKNEIKNIDIVNAICNIMDRKHPAGSPHNQLIRFVKDRQGHDFRYAIDCSKIVRELSWKQCKNFEEGLEETVDWYLSNNRWWESIISGVYKNYYTEQYENR